jgi:hypothetical protein
VNAKLRHSIPLLGFAPMPRFVDTGSRSTDVRQLRADLIRPGMMRDLILNKCTGGKIPPVPA